MDINNISAITNEIYETTPENVVAVGYGKKMVDGKLTSELSIIYGVIEKKPLSKEKITKDDLLKTLSIYKPALTNYINPNIHAFVN